MPRPTRQQLILFLLLTLLAVIYYFLFDFLRWDMFDSPGFVGGARMLFGLEEGFNVQSRLSKPLALVLPGLLEYLLGLHAGYGFILQGVLAYYVSAFLLYAILFRLTRVPQIAFPGTLAYVMCQPLAIFSFMILVDGLGWMLNLLLIWLVLTKLEGDGPARGWVVLLSLIAALGMLVKESVAFGLVFTGCYLLLSGRPHRWQQLLIMGGVFVAAFVASQWVTRLIFDDTVTGRLMQMKDSEGVVYYNRENIAQIFRMMDFYWFLFPAGLFSMKGWIKKYGLNHEAFAFLLAAFLGIVLMPVHPYVADRILFMVAPALMLFVAMGAYGLGRWGLPLIILGGVLNIGVAWLIYRYNISGLLLWVGMGYGLAVGIGWVMNRKAEDGRGSFAIAQDDR